jgi:hypothetical protein
MKRFDSSTTRPAAFTEATKETPIITPLVIFRHLLFALSAGLASGLGFWLMGLGDWPIVFALRLAGLIIIASFIASATGLVELVVKQIEKITNRDLDHDGYVGEPPPVQQQQQPPSLALTYKRSEHSSRLDDLPGPPYVILAWAEVFVRGGSVAYEVWKEQFGYRIDEDDNKISLYREFRIQICSGDRPLAKEQGTHGLKPTKHGYEEFSDLVRVGLDGATPLLTQGEGEDWK